ncbi:MAG: 6-pyruvoyl-tetrahydropterin synthase-related protein [Syntrophobacter sp.]
MTPRNLLSIFRDGKGLLVLLAVEGFLLLLIPPTLVFNTSFIAGGDTPSHYTAAVSLRESLFSGDSLFQWIHGNYAGFPLFLNYFPFPFFIMAVLSLLMPLMIAFKLVTIIPVFGLPAVIYYSLRKLGQRGMAPALGSALSLPFLLMRENAMWGGNIGSTLAGEFSYGISLLLSVYLSAKIHVDIPAGRSLVKNSILEGLAALGNGYPLLQFGFGSSYFLFRKRFIPYLITMHALAFSLTGFWILPLLWRLPWDTPFNHAWLFDSWREPLPSALIPALLGIVLGWSTRWFPDTDRFRGSMAGQAFKETGSGQDHGEARPDARHYLWWNVGIALLCFSVGNIAGLVDVRFLPFAHVFLILLGAIGWGKVLAKLRHPGPWAGIMFLAIFAWAGTSLEPVKSWSRWNYSGFEAKPLWQSFNQVNLHIRGDENSPRIIYEHAEENNDAGTTRAFELLPHFSGRSTLEGLYMQSSLSSPFVFYLQSELSQAPSCPFSGYYYSRFDPERAARHLRLFNVSHVVTVTGETASALDNCPDYLPEISFPPYRIHRVAGPRGSYVEPLRFQPRRISWDGWKKTQFEWFRKADLEVPLVVASEGSHGEYWRQLPQLTGSPASLTRVPVPAADEVRADATLGRNRITVDTSTPNHPLWLKVSYHPDWRIAEGEGEIYPVSPAFILLVPKTHHVVLRFDTGTGIYAVGKILTLAALLFCACLAWQGRRDRSPGKPEGSRNAIRPHVRTLPTFPSLAAMALPPDNHAQPDTSIPGKTGRNASKKRHLSSGSAVYPVIKPVLWCLVAFMLAITFWTRDNRDPILLYNKALKACERADATLSANDISQADTSPAPLSEVKSHGIAQGDIHPEDTPLGAARALFLLCMSKYPLSPVTDHAAHFVASSYMKEQRWEDLTKFYESFLAAYPDSRIYPEALFELGSAASHLRRPQLSDSRFWQVLVYFPESGWAVHAAERLAGHNPMEQLLDVAREYFQREDFVRAAPLLQALSNQRTSPVRSDAALLWGYSHFYRNRWRDSAVALTDWLNEHKDHLAAPEAFVTLGKCYLHLGYYSEARQALHGAVILDPSLADTQPFTALLRIVEDFAQK